MGNLTSNHNEIHGYLTTENIDAVAARLRYMLVGKRCSFVAAHEFNGWRPELRTSQQLTTINKERGNGGIEVWHEHVAGLGEGAGITVSDTYGGWGMSTYVDKEADAKPTTPYLRITQDQIHITPRSTAGEAIHWLIGLELPPPAEDEDVTRWRKIAERHGVEMQLVPHVIYCRLCSRNIFAYPDCQRTDDHKHIVNRE